jgi:hypothetical protein
MSLRLTVPHRAPLCPGHGRESAGGTVPPCPDLRRGTGHGTPTPLGGGVMTGSRRAQFDLGRGGRL